jgi:hypothetical protein
MSVGGEDRINRLERRCRLLLRLYPVTYRAERGEEIIGTLLEATPAGRTWPLPRDSRGLVAGSLRARAALNRRNTTVANLRVAALVGVATCLAFDVAAYLGALVFAAEHGIIDFRGAQPVPYPWPLLVFATLSAVTLVLAWLSRRRAIVLAGALPAAAAVAVVGQNYRLIGFAVTELACLAAVIALSGRERPDRRWLWLIGPIVLARLLMARVLPGTGPDTTAIGVIALCLVLTVAIVSIAWLAIDARPTIVLIVFLLAVWLPLAIDNLATGAVGFLAGLPLLGICAGVAAPVLWLLHRQSAHADRSRQT